MVEELSEAEFLDKKKDFSPLLVHLTKDSKEILPDGEEVIIPAKSIFELILEGKTLKAFKHLCYFSPALNNESEITSIQDKFRVVCFTETPIDQINVLLLKVSKRKFEPEPFGLVFEKSYIRKRGGNPVFYVTRKIARPLMDLIYDEYVEGNEQVPDNICKLLALITLCEEGNDWHWEREWRIVGNFKFNLEDIYCGFCPEEDIEYFENKYPPVKFISPDWSKNKILAKGVGK
jgi:hypothetical protein